MHRADPDYPRCLGPISMRKITKMLTQYLIQDFFY